MKTPARLALLLLAGLIGVQPVFADEPGSRPKNQDEPTRTVFVTGSLIPQRVKLRRIGTDTQSPIRIIDRQEIDHSGRRTAAGVLIVDPSLRVIGH